MAPSVRQAMDALDRTEDIRFSPNNRRLAVGSFLRNRIVVFDIEISRSPQGPAIHLSGGVEISSPGLLEPHGIDFVDDDTIAVANRKGHVTVLPLAGGRPEVWTYEAIPMFTLEATPSSLIDTPGSLAVSRLGTDRFELIVCNNYNDTVSRHLIETGSGYRLCSEQVLLRKWMDIPDGVSLSRDRRWIAISNHFTHSVFIYENTPNLGPDTDPSCILRRVFFPHGVRFSTDDRYIFLADSASPYVHIYARENEGWWGVRHPVASIRVMDEETFQRGHYNVQEGGPKGIDVDRSGDVLAVTSINQTVEFYDISKMIPTTSPVGPADREQRAIEVAYELHVLSVAKGRRDEYANSLSWRLTAPLRRVAHEVLRLIGKR